MKRVEQSIWRSAEYTQYLAPCGECYSETRSSGALAPLRSLLDEQDFALAVSLATAFGAPQPFLGMVAGFSHASKCLSKLCERETFSKLHQFRDATARIATQLSQRKELPPHFSAVPDLHSLSSPFRLFVERGSRYPQEIDGQICAIKALVLTDAVARGKRIPESFASRLLTLQRSAAKGGENSKHWQKLAADLPFNQERAQALFEQTMFDPVREFLRELIPLLNGRVPDLVPKTNERSAPELDSSSGRNSEVVLQDEVTKEVCVTHEEDAVLHDGYAICEGLVAWQNKRSTNAHRLSACGFPNGWDHLHPEELRQATTKLATILSNPSSDNRELACLALVSLAAGLPPKLALGISLEANDDLWLDVDAGLLHWNLNRVVQRGALDSELLESSYHPSPFVRLPLPVLLVSSLKRSSQMHGEACKLDELLFPSLSDRNELFRRYEIFLKLGNSSSHCPRPSRFAYSFGRCILAQTGQDVVAALASLDFTLAAPGQLHYTCLNESVIFDALDKTYKFLGLVEITRPKGAHYVGSPLRPRDELVVEGWQKVLEEINVLKSRITPRMSIDSFIQVFNQLNPHHLCAITFLAGHRGTRLERLTYPMLFSSREFLAISDKESSDYSAYRVLPRIPLLDSILESHLSLLHSLATRLERHDRKLAKRIAAISSGKRMNCPLFFFVREKGGAWKLYPIRSANLTDHLHVYFGAARNFGRHFWLSKLIEVGTARMLPRFFLGHARRGMEPHGSTAGISVRTACEAISPILASIASQYGFSDRFLRQSDNSRPARVSLHFPRILAKLKNDFVSDYIASVDVPGHVAHAVAEPCPFDRTTLASHSFIAFLRNRFVEETKSLTPWPRLLIALIVFDGVSNYSLLEAAWLAIPERLVRLGQTPILDCELPGGTRPILLLPPTAACLNPLVGAPPIAFVQACREVAAWAETMTGFQFSTPVNAIDFLGALMARWMQIEVSPWLVTASSLELSAACISMKSLSRIAHGRPAVLDSDIPESLSPGREARTSLTTELGDLAKIVNELADTAKKYGENRKRLRLLNEALINHIRGSSLSPLASDVSSWLMHEATTEKPLEVSSIASYLGKLRSGLEELDQELVVEDLDPDDWLKLEKRIAEGHAGEQLKQRRSILRRFAGFWRERGCAVPGSIFASADDEDAVIAHASAVYVSKCDVERAATIIADHFKQQPLLKEKATTKFSLCESSPFRSGEISRLRSIDVSDLHPAAFITSSGFSHLKNQKHSRGSVELIPIQWDQLRSLRKQIGQLTGQKDGYLWLLDDPESRFADVAEVDRALGRALRLATGEENARVHSLRGSAIARMVTPKVDNMLKILACANHSALPKPSANDDEWLKISVAARQARHSTPLTTIRYYCATWPIELHFELARSLEFVWICDGYADLIDGLKPSALRQALCRTRRCSPDASFAVWQLLAKRLSKITSIHSVETLLVSSTATPNIPPRTIITKETIGCQHIHYLLLRIAGLGMEVAINESRVPNCYVPMLEELFRHQTTGSGSTVIPPTPDETAYDRKDWQRRLTTAAGQQLLSAAARLHDTRTISMSIQLLDTGAKFDIHEEVLLQTVRTLRAVVPKEFTFNVLPSLTRSSPLLQREFRAIDPEASVKRSSKRHGSGYTLTMTAVVREKRGPQPDGKATSVFRQALRARLLLLTIRPQGEKEDVCLPSRP